MKKIYFVRHQAGGVVHEFPFAQYPTDQQIAAVESICFDRHGFSHKKTPDQPYWTRVDEVSLFEDEIPEVKKAGLSIANVANAAEFSASGIGHVSERAD